MNGLPVATTRIGVEGMLLKSYNDYLYSNINLDDTFFKIDNDKP